MVWARISLLSASCLHRSQKVVGRSDSCARVQGPASDTRSSYRPQLRFPLQMQRCLHASVCLIVAARTEQGPPIGNIGTKEKKKEERMFATQKKISL